MDARVQVWLCEIARVFVDPVTYSHLFLFVDPVTYSHLLSLQALDLQNLHNKGNTYTDNSILISPPLGVAYGSSLGDENKFFWFQVGFLTTLGMDPTEEVHNQDPTHMGIGA